jgi:hypothetical protein
MDFKQRSSLQQQQAADLGDDMDGEDDEGLDDDMEDVSRSAERMVCPYLQPTGVASAASSSQQTDCRQAACPVHGGRAHRQLLSASSASGHQAPSSRAPSSAMMMLLDSQPLMQSVELLFECKVCGKRFQHRSSLSTHFRSHSGWFFSSNGFVFNAHQCISQFIIFAFCT